MGEHGDTSFVPWSFAKISGTSFEEYTEMMKKYNRHITPLDKEGIVEYIHKSGGQIIANKGATFYAVSVSVCRMCSMLLSAYDSIAAVSSMLHGEYGLDDVCLSVPTLIGPKGVQGKVPVKLDEDEMKKLHASANALKEVIKNIKL